MRWFGQSPELLKAQHALERFGGCFHCRERRLMEGPSGGACTNVECDNCGMRMNVVSLPDGPMVLEIQGENSELRAAYETRQRDRETKRWSRRLSNAIRRSLRFSEKIPHA